jgi:hypothetical protein
VIVTPDFDAYAATEISVCDAIEPLGIERSALDAIAPLGNDPAAWEANVTDGLLRSALEAIVPLKLAIA